MSEPEEHNSAESQIARKQAAVVEAHDQAITSKAEGVRTRAQLKLASDMLAKYDRMQAIVREIAEKNKP